MDEQPRRAERRRLSPGDRGGRPRMVDVSDKPPTARRAVAEAEVGCSQETLSLVIDGAGPKGDVLTVAEMAGVMAAKRTAELIPLCHPLALTDVSVAVTPDRADRGRDGGPDGRRRGGPDRVRHGQGRRARGRDPAYPARLQVRRAERVVGAAGRCPGPGAGPAARRPGVEPSDLAPEGRAVTAPSAFVLTVSDRGSTGERADASGAALARRLGELGFAVERGLVPDDADAISAALEEAAARHRLVLTTGGTGLGPRDVTPEATAAVLERMAPGIAEAIRADGRTRTPYAALSRGVAGTRGACLIVNLPGSPRGAAESLAVLEPLFDHALATLAGPVEHDDATRPNG